MPQITPETVLSALAHHKGQSKGVHVSALVMQITGQLFTTEANERSVRKAVTALRMEGEPVCGHPTHGYFMAETHAELDHTRNFLRARALSGLKAYNRLKRTTGSAQLLGQPAPSTTTEEEARYE